MVIKKIILRKIIKSIVKKNMLTTPKVIHLPDMQFIGYKITTTLRNNKQREDIPPFYHYIYDNNRLAGIKPEGEFKMYCLFKMHDDMKNFDYYVAVENSGNVSSKSFERIRTTGGEYVKIEFLKRNNKAVSMIIMYIKSIWMKQNGFKAKTAPFFIVYDQRFHTNYQKFGYHGNDYLGSPLATLYFPIEN